MLTLKRFRNLILILITASFLSACGPHPGTGEWLSTTDNEDNINKITVFFEPKVLFYSAGSIDPVMQCGWWGLDNKKLEMECVHLADTDTKEKYQIRVIAKGEAELLKDNRLITKLIRQ